MVGTTFKLGFDGTSVKQGLSKIGGSMKSFGKNIGSGLAMGAGIKMTDWIGGLVTAIPEATKEMLEWSGSMVDLSDATRISIKDLILFSEAIRNAGFDGDPTKAIVTFTDQLYEAKRGSEQAQEAFNKLGLKGSDFIGKDTMQSIKIVAERIAAMGDSLENPGGIMRALFGGKGGIKLIAAFKDLPKSMKEAESYMGSMLKDIERMARGADDLDDVIGRWPMVRRSLIGGILEGMGGKDLGGLKSMAEMIFNLTSSLRPIFVAIGTFIKPLIDYLNKTMKTFMQLGAGGFFQGILESIIPSIKYIGKILGEGIKESVFPTDKKPFSMQGISGAMKYLSPAGFMMDKLMNGKKSTSMNGDRLLQETTEQTDILQRIYSKNPTAIFA